jgi:hypothetical protein
VTYFTRTLVAALFLAFAGTVWGQGPGRKSKFIRSIQKTVWTAGVNGVVIDDDANSFKKHFDVKENWNLLPFPTNAHLEGFIDKGFSVEGAFTYMRLKKGKILGDNVVRNAHHSLFSFDVNAKYDLNELIGDTKAFSPYLVAGLGYTYRSVEGLRHAITGNFGFGFNVWVYKGWGLNVQSMAKFALNKASHRNYLQHSVGVVYRFNLLTGYRTPNRLGHRYNLFRNQ